MDGRKSEREREGALLKCKKFTKISFTFLSRFCAINIERERVGEDKERGGMKGKSGKNL